jgi:hypothetical protein
MIIQEVNAALNLTLLFRSILDLDIESDQAH